MRVRWPEGPSRTAVGILVATWTGVVAGRMTAWWILILVSLVFWLGRSRSGVLIGAVALTAGLLAGGMSTAREQRVLAAVVPDGPITLYLQATMDPVPGRFGGSWFIARPFAQGDRVPWQGPPILVSGEAPGELSVGEGVVVEGVVSAHTGFARGSPYAGRLRASQITTLEGATPLVMVAGNTVRDHIIRQLGSPDPARALLAGFLVGATDQLPAVDHEALRRAGLAHFVAVSGSNVAGFLLLWWLVLGPIAMGRRRGVMGLAGLVLFVIVTRWEPSVVRAALMAGTVLTGRVIGWPIDSWVALGASATLALLVSPELAGDVGFQLSVVATGGILAGPDILPTSIPRWLAAPLGATLAAQIAVLPILLAVFGTVPLLSPLTNLVAGPLVAASTMIGGVGTLSGFTPLVEIGAFLAGIVLVVARAASSWPQIEGGAALLLLAGGFGLRFPRLRPWVVLVAATAISWPLLAAPASPRLAAVFLDVGQGDATLLIGASGEAVLVDGGPDPVTLQRALDRYQVRHLALVVVTHAHQDHVAGLSILPGRYRVGSLWYPGPPHTSPAWEDLRDDAIAAGIRLEVPRPGLTSYVDGLRLRVVGPLRRYDGINDQSVVLWVDAGATRILLTGDVEIAAQADLGVMVTDVLKVPHHGALTSDLDWLADTRPLLSVISVGENDYGHPHPAVLEALADSVTIRTDQIGDVVVPLVGDPLSLLPVSTSDRSP
ncbi:MAG TPA: ComEC/Rec2 family competence protein [Acidimicrobiia bacterium]|nr:ComEC/Rec2 family competence protein [Acidimicrobiia bacterium]